MKTFNIFYPCFILTLLCGVTLISCDRKPNLYKQLDKELKLKEHYQNQKLTRIGELTKYVENNKENISLKEQYAAYLTLSEEYTTFRFDSAYKFTAILVNIAKEIDEPAYIIDAKTRHSYIMANGGFYREAIESLLLTDLNDENIPDSTKANYYISFGRIYHNAGDYTKHPTMSEEYYELGNEQLEKALALIQDSVTIYWLEGKIALKKGQLDIARQKYRYAVENFDMSSSMQSLLLSTLAHVEITLGNYDKAIEDYIQAAIDNIHNVKTESVALRGLATVLFYNKDEVNRASEYINIALEDAKFYSSKQRMSVIGEVLPIIIGEKLSVTESQRNHLRVYLIIIAVLAVAFIAAFISSIVQMKRLKKSKIMLQNINMKLLDANHIKDEYIGHYFHIYMEIVDQIDRFARVSNRMLTNKQYDGLRNLVSNLSAKYDKDSTYHDFDMTFLKLFPTFVADFNALLKEEDRIVVPENTLNSTLRIFALIRLGITSSEQISKILNYSLNTIYNYRTRVKNKSIVGSDKFEEYVGKIGS